MALVAYRHLLRAASLAFRGDTPLLSAARDQVRDGFRRNASLPVNDPSVAIAIEHAEGVALILRQNIVQGEPVGNDMYKLRIRDETERGDNDTVKMPNGQQVIIDGKTCVDR